jgi:nucleoside-diphosphate-sugar epimerase
VQGTRNALEASRRAGVRRFVHVGTEAALMAGDPLVDVDETAPLRPDSKALYPATKAQAEMAVREANGADLETVVVRPRLVWGVGDTTIMPGLAEAVRAGRFRWINGGRHLTATTHVENTVEGLWLGATKGRPGEAYFVTDGEPVVFREFISDLLATQRLEIPDKDAPAAVARLAGPVLEGLWGVMRRTSPPPITRLTYWLSAQECTIDISKARSELGYAPVKTRSEGMQELEEAAA